MDTRSERVLIETERHRIFGRLTLPRGGYRSRMSDYLNSADRDFIALTDVVVEQLDGDRKSVEREFVVVSRRHIVIALPLGGDDGDQPADEVA